ncbi:hypothetical protein SERLADRAFT_477889, partial [Serpula lacrymans var. lacrymans S7.9]
MQPKKSAGLFQLDTQAAARSRLFPEIEQPSYSPLPMMPAAMSSHDIDDPSPSPPPSQVVFRRPPPSRRPSVPNLRLVNTKSLEKLNA